MDGAIAQRGGVRVVTLTLAGCVAGAGIAAALSWTLSDDAPRPRALAAPAAGKESLGARMRVNNMRFSPAHRDAPAALDLDVVNEGRGAATGIGYVLQDDALVVSFVETSVLGPGEAEHQRLTWNSVGPGSRHMTLTIGNGAAKWIVHSFDVVSLDEGSRSVAPAAAGAGTGIGAGLGLAAALGLRRVTR